MNGHFHSHTALSDNNSTSSSVLVPLLGNFVLQQEFLCAEQSFSVTVFDTEM